MASNVTRRNFVQASALAGAGMALGGPLTAYATRTQQEGRRRRVAGYGPLQPRPEADYLPSRIVESIADLLDDLR